MALGRDLCVLPQLPLPGGRGTRARHNGRFNRFVIRLTLHGYRSTGLGSWHRQSGQSAQTLKRSNGSGRITESHNVMNHPAKDVRQVKRAGSLKGAYLTATRFECDGLEK